MATESMKSCQKKGLPMIPPSTVMLVSLLAIAGCTSGSYRLANRPQEDLGSGYCHKRLSPVGPSDLARSTQTNGDYIDYYGPCEGPTAAEQAEKQRRFEQFRFGRDYMDEG
jgi:hypothetical protein